MPAQPNATVPYLYVELHTDGAGAIAMPIGWSWAERAPTGSAIAPGTPLTISDESMALDVIGALCVLGRHAERTGASGYTNVLLSVTAVGENAGDPWRFALGNPRSFLRERLHATRLLRAVERIAHTLPIDALASPGPELVASAYLVLADLFTAFGAPVPFQCTSDGEVRVRYFRNDVAQAIRGWCAQHDISVTEETPA
jgi:hypothetical protein